MAPPIDIAKLSIICVGKKPFCNNQFIADLIGSFEFETYSVSSLAFTSIFKPALLCCKKVELNIIEKSDQNCFWFAKALAAAKGLFSFQLIKLTVDRVWRTADLELKNIVVPIDPFIKFINLLTNLLLPKLLLVPFSIL